MNTSKGFKKNFIFLLIFSLAAVATPAQKKDKDAIAGARPVIWEEPAGELDLFLGPGGEEMVPNLRKVAFVKEDKNGHNKKYEIKDASGRTWIAKLGSEAQPETAAVRILYGLGYKTEINYLAPKLTIQGGTTEVLRGIIARGLGLR